MNFLTEEKLLYRLTRSSKRGFGVLMGSGVTTPRGTGRGVAGVSSIISDVSNRLKNSGAGEMLAADLENRDPREHYQVVMQTLYDLEGAESVNEIVRTAVCGSLKRGTQWQNLGLDVIEREPDYWTLNPGIEALGRIAVTHRSNLASPILTSNFDPHLEIAIRRAGGGAATICLNTDGSFDDVRSNEIQVVHFHGYWYGRDTLHTHHQLVRSRPQLRGSLRKLLADRTLLVIGYAGWDDVLTGVLHEAVAERADNFNILWAFHEEDEALICNRYDQILKKFGDYVGHRIFLYKKIDSDVLFPKLSERMVAQEKPFNVQTSSATTDLRKPASFPAAAQSEGDELECDLPPEARCWIGRNDELEAISGKSFRIVALTGVGGQGKSSLAARYVAESSDVEWEFWDWRDCKEEENRMHTHLIRIIERLTEGRLTSKELVEEAPESLVDLMFQELGQRRVLFVFDNVDRYVDLENLTFTGAVRFLFNAALNKPHQSKFIFTCRPRIKSQDSSFIEFNMGGLSSEHTVDLFKSYRIRLSEDLVAQYAVRAHTFTDGHPLWLHLIAAQASTNGQEAMDRILQKCTPTQALDPTSPTQILAEETFKIVWKSLSAKQQSLLRGLAEMVTAETAENLAEIFKEDFSFNKLNKVLRSLLSLNLVVVKNSKLSAGKIDLHPLVREFIKNRFTTAEQSKHINKIIAYFDQIIYILRPKISTSSSFAVFEKWLLKIELQIARGDEYGALNSLQEIGTLVLGAGHFGAYIRVTELLYSKLDWVATVAKEVSAFHVQVENLVDSLVQMGRCDKAETFLDRYEKSIDKNGTHSIQLCDMWAYFFWYQDDYQKAIQWGEMGCDLKKRLGVVETDRCTHNLSLALRDSREDASITRALEFFRSDITVEEILRGEVPPVLVSVPFYGNVGRCLQFLGDDEGALICYKKALNMNDDASSAMSALNSGYGNQWISEVLDSREEYEDAYCFLGRALSHWERVSPPRAKQIGDDLRGLERKINGNTKHWPDWQMEDRCRKYLASPDPMRHAKHVRSV